MKWTDLRPDQLPDYPSGLTYPSSELTYTIAHHVVSGLNYE